MQSQDVAVHKIVISGPLNEVHTDHHGDKIVKTSPGRDSGLTNLHLGSHLSPARL